MKRRVMVAAAFALYLTALAGASPSTSPVADAAMRADRDGVRALLKQGADVGGAQGDGMTALHWAAERGDVALADMLLYAGANVAAVTRIGQYTPLHLASRAGSVKAPTSTQAFPIPTITAHSPAHIAPNDSCARRSAGLLTFEITASKVKSGNGSWVAESRRISSPRREIRWPASLASRRS